MLIIPFHEKAGWKHLPFATFVLIAINILVYNSVQNNSTINDATHYYFSSKLYQYELPHYLRYLKRNRPIFVQKLKRLSTQDQHGLLYKALLVDRHFNQRLDAELVITKADKDYFAWNQKRIMYREIYTRIALLNYGFTPAHNSLMTAVSYMFLHKNTTQLIGNMIFLLFLGFALEKILGRIVFCLTYIGSGIFAAEFFTIFNTTLATPIVGASGAIPGLFAVFTIIFGFRKIKFYYWAFFYTGYFRVPAIYLLPLWLSYIGQAIGNSHTMIQLGGLIVGIVIALSYKTIHSQANSGFIESDHKKQHNKTSLNQARQALARLNYHEAAELFHSLLHESPDNIEILKYYHAALTELPVSEAYHSVTLRLLTQSVSTLEEAKSSLYHYQHYMKRTGNSARIKPPQSLTLAKIFARFGLVLEAEKMVCDAIKHPSEKTILPELLLILANAFFKLNQEDVQIHYLTLLIKNFPHTEEALIATTFLYEKPVQHLKIH